MSLADLDNTYCQTQTKRSGVHLGTRNLLDFQMNFLPNKNSLAFQKNLSSANKKMLSSQNNLNIFQNRRSRALATRQRHLTDSMILDEASNSYLKAFSEQVTRLKRLTEGLQKFDVDEYSRKYQKNNDSSVSECAGIQNEHAKNEHQNAGIQNESSSISNYNDQINEDFEGFVERHSQVQDHNVDGGNSNGQRTNWRALSYSLSNGYPRLHTSSISAVEHQKMCVPAALSTPNANGNQEDKEWPQVSPATSRIANISHQNHLRQKSPNLSSTQNTSYYECPENEEKLLSQDQSQIAIYSVNGSMVDHQAGKLLSTVSNKVGRGAPLAKPEPIADLEKPAFDSRQISKQAATAAPQAKRFGSSTIYPQHERDTLAQYHYHHKTIRFADEDEDEHRLPDDDPGIMSEAETSATSGASSAVKRRQMWQRKQEQEYIQANSAYAGDASPSIHRRTPNRDPQHQHLNVPSTAIIGNPKHKAGIVFLQYQGETKRSLLPTGYDGTTKTALYSMDDVRILFLKAFQSEMTPEYLQSQLVKIYIQDPTKTDVFYELEDLNDIKDRSVLKLHESTRPNSPPPAQVTTQTQLQPQLQHQFPSQSDNRRMMPPLLDRSPIDQKSISRSSPRQQLMNELRSVSVMGYQHPYHQEQTSSDDTNYFSEPEFHMNGDYRLRKSSSTNYCASPMSPVDQQRRHYGTVDRCYSSSNRTPYRGHQQPQVPPKPERHFGPGVPSGGRMSTRRSQSPTRPLTIARQNYGHSTDPEDTYGIRTPSTYHRDYATSPTSDILETLYNRPPSVTRSGSVTPVIDEEARIRMINMEKQLVNLSSLVHSALMSKGVNETVYKDLEMLRREILGGGGSQQGSTNGHSTRDDVSESGSISRFSDISSEKGSGYQSERDGLYTNTSITNHTTETPSSLTNGSNTTNGQYSPEIKQSLKTCKRRVGEIQNELKNLRRLAQLNAQSSRDILKDTFDRIKVILNTNKHLHMFATQAQQQNHHGAVTSDRNWADQEQDRYRKSMQRVERDLGDLEKQVEEMRQKVISGDRKLRMTEVEAFTEVLGHIGRLAAHLKTGFPTLEDRLKQVMSAEMEKVVREEKFLKDEPTRVDNALKRCKKLTNTMVTMKKLAMVQDPAAYYGNSHRSHSPIKSHMIPNQETHNGTKQGHPSPLDYKRLPSNEDTSKTMSSTNGHSTSSNVAVVAPSPATRSTNPPPTNGTGHVLDTLLEELQNVAKSPMDSVISNGTRQEGPTEKAPVPQTAPEKKVGFADQVQVLCHEQENKENDTIKRGLRIQNGLSNGDDHNGANSSKDGNRNGVGSNGHYMNMNINGAQNGYSTTQLVPGTVSINYGAPADTGTISYSTPGTTSNGHGAPATIASGYSTPGQHLNPPSLNSRGRSASPLTPHMFAYGSGRRSHSGTPSSVNSDPTIYHHAPPPPPPPPPRSSSRSILTNGNGSQSESRYKNFDIDELKEQLTVSSSPMTASTKPTAITVTPAAIVQTNAVDEEPRIVKSASSSESVNSQDGRMYHQRHGVGFANGDPDREQVFLAPPGKPPPPPPPPRNKQEMLEQRKHELMAQQHRHVYQF